MESAAYRRKAKIVIFYSLVCFISVVYNVRQSPLKEPKLLDLPTTRSSKQVSDATFTSQHQPHKKEDYLLNVPFYIYPELDMLDEVTVGNKTLLHESVAGGHSIFGAHPKHADDYYFIKAAKQHPMRTFNPADAKLFVVSLPANHIVWSVMYNIKPVCWKNMCGKELLKYTDQILHNSTWFQKSKGRDHIAPFGIWGWDHKNVKGKHLYKNYAQCNFMGFGEDNTRINSKDRLKFNNMYVGMACPPTSSLYDFAMVATLKPKDERYKSRQDICNWMQKPQHQGNHTWSVCGKGSQCPALAQSRFGFHVRGDSFGANRLFDTILSGTVPIFTMKQQYVINAEWFDWDKISYFADVNNQTSFLESMQRIMNDPKGYEMRQRNVLLNRDLFDWTTAIPFDTYMYMLQAHLWPETRQNRTRFTALKLP
jgi:hypothetical protein